MASKNVIAPVHIPWVARVAAKLLCTDLYATAHLIVFINGGILGRHVNMNIIMAYGGNVRPPVGTDRVERASPLQNISSAAEYSMKIH